MRILIVEDDEFVSHILKKQLSARRYAVDIAKDGKEGFDYAEAAPYDLIILDVQLPKLNGVHLCQKLRQSKFTTPILMLTAQTDISLKVNALDSGADDYLTKPFHHDELLSRVRALLRRSHDSGSPLLLWGKLQLDPSNLAVSYDNSPLTLTPKEFGLLELFLRNPKRIFKSDAILQSLWDFADFPSEETVRTHIKRLRYKLKSFGVEDILETVYGMGYRLSKPPLPSEKPSCGDDKLVDGEDPSSLEVRYHVQHLWKTQLRDRALERIGVLEKAIMGITQGELPDELYENAVQIAHKFAGSLGMFGLSQASAEAREIEQLLHQIHGLFHTEEAVKLNTRSMIKRYYELQSQIQGAMVRFKIELSGNMDDISA